MEGKSVILSDEGRKRVLLIAAAILAARKLCQLESTRPSPALHSIIADAVIFAEWIMQRMQKKSPVAFIGAQPWGGQGFCLRAGWGSYTTPVLPVHNSPLLCESALAL